MSPLLEESRKRKDIKLTLLCISNVRLATRGRVIYDNNIRNLRFEIKLEKSIIYKIV